MYCICQLKLLKYQVVKEKLTSRQTDRYLEDSMHLNFKR